MSAKTLISIEEFDRLDEEEFRYELDEGELITLTRPGTDHGRIERRLLIALQTYLDDRGGGEAFGPDVLFVLGPNTKRAPDVSVVLREVGSVKEIIGAPDIAAEILSLSNTRKEMQRKPGQFFATGCKTCLGHRPQNARHRNLEIRRRPIASPRRIGFSGNAAADGLHLPRCEAFLVT